MSFRLCILGSGSGGNAAVIQTTDTCLLIDAGLSIRALKARLAARNMALDDVDALIITHTHGDHLRSSAITACVSHRILMYNHPANESIIAGRYRRHFSRLADRRLNAAIGDGALVIGDLTINFFGVPHDADGITLALTIEHGRGEDRQRVAFATDLGSVPNTLLDTFTDSDVVVLEFNHDVEMLQTSKRTSYLKNRVNGTHGHLSNSQAAAALRTLLARAARPLLAVVPAHLSRECNTPDIVTNLVRDVLRKHDAPGTHVILAEQDAPTEWLDIPAMRGQPSLFK